MAPRHKVFVSYHHEKDQAYKNIFELRFGNAAGVIIPGSVGIGDIDPTLTTDTIRQKIRDEYLQDSTVTVVLVGAETWQRKHVDWEIASSLRDTKNNARSGLLGLLLPGRADYEKTNYDQYTIPPRLYDNVHCGYALLKDWTNDADRIADWIHQAFDRRTKVAPDLSRDPFRYNKSGASWR